MKPVILMILKWLKRVIINKPIYYHQRSEDSVNCLLSDRSIVKLSVQSKTQVPKFLPSKIQESSGLMRRFNLERFKSSKASASTLVQLNEPNKIKIAQEMENPLKDYFKCCSILDQHWLILA
uniref:Uncharacterized protein n=1 Tax=Romanomermis culicivorax TaxID=13658 RepID=A0A915ICI7_ROMCU